MSGDRPSIELDHYDEGFAEDPYARLVELRQECPIGHSESHGGFWFVTRHDDVREVAQRPEVFSSRFTSVPNEFGLGEFPIPPVQLDPPGHARVKRLLAGAFVPAKVAPYEPRVRAYSAALAKDLAARDSFDAAGEFARLVPTALVSWLLGAPDSIDAMGQWVDRMLEQAATDPGDALAAGVELMTFVGDLVERRRKDPGPDLLSELAAQEVDGDRLTDEELTFFGILLVMAGIDTAQNTLGCAIHHLATHPDAQARLRAEPETLGTAIEEFLRAFAPVSPARVVSEDTELGGCRMAEGEMVVLSLLSANRDEAIFDRADEVVLDRTPNRHLAFGTGIHRCLGVNFARMELAVALEELLASVPPFELTPGKTVTWTLGQVRGPRNLFISPVPEGGS